MINNSAFFDSIIFTYDGRFGIGVPDSLLKQFTDYIASTLPKFGHIIVANEGASVGIAAGFHLASYDIPLVYL